MTAISEPFELESSDWAHFLRLFEFCPDSSESNHGCASPPRGESGRRCYALAGSHMVYHRPETVCCMTIKQTRTAGRVGGVSSLNHS
jgi:hypothetical protein